MALSKSVISGKCAILKKCNIVCYKARLNSWFGAVKMGPPDPILSLTDVFNKDEAEKKINLGVGVYRDDDGKPWILPSVKAAEELILCQNLDKEYGPIIGRPEFYKKSVELALGKDSESFLDDRYAACQSTGGTGALRIGAAFLSTFFPGNRIVYLPTPTWPNHPRIFLHAGMKVKQYRYIHPKTKSLDFAGLIEDICNASEMSIILFHACAHNPTGVDPTEEQWREISRIVKARKSYVFFDMAYQGFASGDIHFDAKALRIFEDDCHAFSVAQSYAKNMGLYGERVGCYFTICSSKEEATCIISQLKILIRGLYSSSPISGARIATEILNNEEIYKQWVADLVTMSCRLKHVRQQLTDQLKEVGSSHNWDHINNQIGMFCFSGLTKEQVDRLRNEFHIYMTADGRMSMAGIRTNNVKYLAESMHTVSK